MEIKTTKRGMRMLSTKGSLTRKVIFLLSTAILTSAFAYIISLSIPRQYCVEAHIHLDGAMSRELARSAIYYLEYFLYRTRLVEEKVARLMGNTVTVEKLRAAHNIELYRDNLTAGIILFWPDPEEGKRLLRAFAHEAVELAITKTLNDKKRELKLISHKIEVLKRYNSKTSHDINVAPAQASIDQYQREEVRNMQEVAALQNEVETLSWDRIISGPYVNPKMARPLKIFNAGVGFLVGLLLALLFVGLRYQRRHERNENSVF